MIYKYNHDKIILITIIVIKLYILLKSKTEKILYFIKIYHALYGLLTSIYIYIYI